MKIAIIGAATGTRYYRLLDNKLNRLIEKSQCFLFTIVCGYIKGRKSKEPSLGEIWAKENGCPIEFISENTVEKLVHKLFLKVDYVIFILDGTPLINNIFMKYKMLGKHGSVIRVDAE